MRLGDFAVTKNSFLATSAFAGAEVSLTVNCILAIGLNATSVCSPDILCCLRLLVLSV